MPPPIDNFAECEVGAFLGAQGIKPVDIHRYIREVLGEKL
jgi:hypothetical protein